MKTHYIILAITIITSLCSCVGGGVVHGKEQQYENFSIKKSKSPLFRLYESNSKNNNPDKEEVKSKWGTPSKIITNNQSKIWVYDTDTAMSGVVPMIGVGVPIVAPTGKNGIDIYFNGNSTVADKAIRRYTSWSGGYYGAPDESGTSGSGWQKLGD